MSEIPYLRGVPSVAIVAAHEVDGGWWHARYRHPWGTNERRAVNLIVTQPGNFIQAADGNDGHYFGTKELFMRGGRDERENDLDHWELRPCTPDLTPMPWPRPATAKEAP